MGRARLVLLGGLCGLCAVGAGCGGSKPEVHAVQVSLLAPTDGATVVVPKIDVLGNVSPRDGIVYVAGRRVRVVDGQFKTPVSLRRGTTKIKVVARARGYLRASTSIKVRYRPLATRSGESGPAPTDLAKTLRLAGFLPTSGQPSNAEAQAQVTNGCVAFGGTTAFCHCMVHQLVAQGYGSTAKLEVLGLEYRDSVLQGGPLRYPRPMKNALVSCVRLVGQ